MTGWVSFFAGFSAPIAVTALAFTEYLSHFFPAIAQAHTPIVLGSGMFSLHLGPAQAVACGLIAVLTILNCLGVGLAAKVQNSLTTTNLCVLAAFVVLGLTLGTGSWSHFSAACRAHVHRLAARAIRHQPALGDVWIQRLECGDLRGRGSAPPGTHAAGGAGSGQCPGCGAVPRAECGLHLFDAARTDEGRDQGGRAGGLEPVRAGHRGRCFPR